MGGCFVEFFSEEALENITVLLKYKPERIIFLGHKHNMLTKKMKSLQNFAEMTSPSTAIEFIEVPRDDFELCVKTINDILTEHPNARFELTGGGEMLLIAFGYISSKKAIKTLRIDPYTGTEVDFSGDEVTKVDGQVHMTVMQDIILHGGTLTRSSGSFATWEFTEDFRKDVQKIWDLSKALNHKWNKYCSIIEDVIKKYPADENDFYTLPKSELDDAVNLFYRLRDLDALRGFVTEKREIIFQFKNKMIKNIVTKTGNILELHVYEVASRRKDIFNDYVISAVIDWDGEIKEPRLSAPENPEAMYRDPETINEIDVILMHNVVPTFISCKSGRVDSKALHELQTVTSRFGGKYAKKAIVMATPCNEKTSGTNFFKQRAKDMHIWVIDNVYEMSDEQLLKKLIRIQGQ